jgi:hypothetical protein
MSCYQNALKRATASSGVNEGLPAWSELSKRRRAASPDQYSDKTALHVGSAVVAHWRFGQSERTEILRRGCVA